MKKDWTCVIGAVLLSLVVSFFAVSCFEPSTPPAEISGSVIIANRIESTTYVPNPSDYLFWVVKFSVKNLAYKYPIEVSSKAFSTRGVWAMGSKNTEYPIKIYGFSETGNLSVGQSGQFIALLAAPHDLSVGDVQLVYLGQEPYSYAELSLEDRVAAYNWDTKTVTARMPSRVNLALAILCCFLLAGLRWYPEVSRMIRGDSEVKSDMRMTETGFNQKLNHPILGIVVIFVVGLLIYYLYPSIGYESLIPAIVIAAIYIVGRWICNRRLR